MKKLIVCIVLWAAAGFTSCDQGSDPEQIAITGIALDTEAFALKLGTTRRLTAAVTPADATDPTIAWRSDDETIATVDPATGVVTGCGLGTTIIRATPATDRSPESHSTVAVLATNPYVVGDLYPDATTPQGMVFWIDPSSPTKGKVVSLDETRTRWGDSESATQALDSNNGQANRSTIEALDDWRNNYPAFAWCAAKGEGWYLPALNELLALYEAKEVLDGIIQQNGDTPFASGDYWTSTERRLNPENTAVTVLFRHASDNESWASKDGICSVRAIKAF